MDYVEKNFPEQAHLVSQTPSPMVMAGRYIKKRDPSAKVIFIGPCVAKKKEVKLGKTMRAVDSALTFEELYAMFEAKDIDLSTLLINMLDNAVLAASAVPDAAARTLTLRMEYARGRLLILCRNSYTGAVQMNKDGLPASHRGEWHGQGTRLMRRVAEKYGGVLDVRTDGGAFTLRTVLTLETTPPAPKT